jgi:hypothetical protein
MRQPRWLFAAMMALLGPALSAQQARGVVRDSMGGTPIPGVVVIVLDTSGSTAARTITDAAGRFTVQAALSAPRLRLMRIGYRLRDVTIGTERGDLVLSMEKIPPILERVRVTDNPLCPGSSDRGNAFLLWEQARAGLLATVVAREQNPANAKTIIYEQSMSPGDEIIRRQTKKIGSGRTTRPFSASAEPSYFARKGYMVEDRAGRLFYGPDADVLLHESFVTTHCFRLRAADSAHVGQTGLAFSPVPGRDTLVDVTGVIWMDAGGTQLRSLDFTFTSLEPPAIEARAGGKIEFRSMPNGVAFIERWILRLAHMQVNNIPRGAEVITRAPVQVARRDRMDVRVVDLIEAGGIVAEALWPDGTVWKDTSAIVSGVVTQRRTDGAVSGALVTLAGTTDTVATDSAGRFQLTAIPGRYVLNVTDTVLQSFVKQRSTSRRIAVSRTSADPLRIELPPVSEIVADICRGDRMGIGSVIITGLASTADASSLSGVRVEATWRQQVLDRTGVAAVGMSAETKLDDDGRFVVCGPARDLPLTLRLFKGSTPLADTTFTVRPTGMTQRVLWRVPP